LAKATQARRIHQVAKELGIDSKVIIAKCLAEGVNPDLVKNHMAALSVGLEASIRDWFSDAQADEGHTAVETAEKVDIERVKTTKRRPRAKGMIEGGPATEEAAHPASAPESEADEALHPVAGHAPAVAEPPPEPIAEPEPEPIVHAPVVARPYAPAPEPAEPPVVTAPLRAKPTPIVVEPPAEAPPHHAVPERRHAVHAEAAQARIAPSVIPAPMNVPTRPLHVRPAGKQLQVQAPVKLSGPKVIRVEAPEVIQAPRARRPGPTDSSAMPSSRGPRSGTGVGPPRTGDGGSADDRARRGPGGSNNKRRTVSAAVPARRQGKSGDEWKAAGPGFSEQDLLEREARLSRASGLLKKRRQDLKTKGGPAERAVSAAETGGRVRIIAPFTIKDLSAATGVKGAEISKKLFLQGIMAGINSGIDPAKAQEIMIDYDIELEVVEAKTAEQAVSDEFGSAREAVDRRHRGPVVTILGHVDHGKTSLLDKIRNANVAAGEAGGITQKTSAFRTPVETAGETKFITFLDTPGHEAFTAMRARGAGMTDVVVLVVSAPEGVMPQTIESINHAKAAKVPIVVALNKVDRPDATPAAIQKTLSLLAEAGLNPVEWGGDTEIVKTSATQGTGITELLETLDYQAQLLDLQADFEGPAIGTVIESRIDEGRGVIASILIQQGKLKVGEFIVAGRSFGRVREIVSDRGEKLKEATPPMPVQVSGLDNLPDAGDKFYITDSLKKAQEAAEQRHMRDRQSQLAQPKATLDTLFSQMADKTVKEILVVLKADVQGSVDVLKNEIEKITTSEVKVRVLHAAVGGINESDVLLADASRAVVIGFNVIATGKARQEAERRGIEIRTDQVIYHITDDIKKAAEGLLAPELRQEVLGHAEVRAVFKVSKVGTIAGCYVTDGIVQRDALIRVTRAGVVVENDRILEQLKRFKDDAKDVRAGMECGMKIVGYDDIKEGDVLECYKRVEVKRKLSDARE
jgi:translation initiation factor IF-2